jgi:hypothetical protein
MTTSEGPRTGPGAFPRGKIDLERLRAFRRLSLENALAEITQLLETRGVRPLLLKGPAFAHWLYDDPRERSYRDLDLLVGPDGFDAAMRGLAELSFERESASLRANEGAPHHEKLVRSGAPGTFPVIVELHHTLRLLLSAPPSLVWQRLTEGVQTLEVAGAHVRVPSEAVSALIVVLHASQHGVSGRRAMSDLQRAVDRVDLDIWRKADALAWELGAGPAFAAGLRLDPAGRDVADKLGLGDTTPRAVRLLDPTQPPTASGIELLIATRGAGARLKLLASELVPSPGFMRYSSALARRGRLGLVGAYLWRPIQLARGTLAWSRAAASSLGSKRNRGRR